MTPPCLKKAAAVTAAVMTGAAGFAILGCAAYGAVTPIDELQKMMRSSDAADLTQQFEVCAASIVAGVGCFATGMRMASGLKASAAKWLGASAVIAGSIVEMLPVERIERIGEHYNLANESVAHLFFQEAIVGCLGIGSLATAVHLIRPLVSKCCGSAPQDTKPV